MRIFFSVGEPSGDLHGSNLIRHLKSQPWQRKQATDQRPPASKNSSDASGPSSLNRTDQHVEIECVGFGGPKMREAGCDLHFELTTMAVMFITQVIKNIRLFFRLIGEADRYFASHQVDAVVLIDYPGFNWWIARKAKKHGIPVFYYGVPQMWAWAPWRIGKLKRLVDHVLCKLPFEASWFTSRGCNAVYVGHPYFDQLEHQEYDQSTLTDLGSQAGPLLTLLPGSRNQEVASVLPILLDAAEQVVAQVPDCRVAVASYNPHQAKMAIEMTRQRVSSIEVRVGQTPELMKAATVCLACSGSVSMELMHYRKPTLIVFKVKRWMMWAQSILLNAKFITLVNLIATDDIRKRTWRAYDPDAPGAEQAVMPEYLTAGNPAESVARRAIHWLQNEAARQENIQQLDNLAQQYARPGATHRAAEYLLDQLGLQAQQRTASDQSSSSQRSAAASKPGELKRPAVPERSANFEALTSIAPLEGQLPPPKSESMGQPRKTA